MASEKGTKCAHPVCSCIVTKDSSAVQNAKRWKKRRHRMPMSAPRMQREEWIRGTQGAADGDALGTRGPIVEFIL